MSKFSLDLINPKLLFTSSRAIAALRPAVIAFLVSQGTQLSGGVATPISFCNVLFVGNLCAAIAVGFWFKFPTIVNDFKILEKKVIFGLFINGCLAALLSALIFLGLESTSVTNAVLLSRFGPVLFALAGAFFLGKKITKLELFGFTLILVGILAITLRESMYQLNRGDVLILASAVVYAITALIGKLILSDTCSLAVVVFTRNFVSSVIFFIIASALFGPTHFSDVFSGQLWIVMSIYALIIIVFAQLLWYSALGRLDSRTVGSLASLSPVFGVTYAYFLNGERPSEVQISSFFVIMIGLVISNLGKAKPKQKERDLDKMPEPECSANI
ncbi:DMT(drug/metabolite transporter) superfamily permease [Xenococcus sp. PCC 7305]|uniref:DMT family transporter n=1 Tax=Xenococcus sp. PCC 7305 TaxID=102125 RepID=UPI0002AC5BDA|nr:DMT family transporter [Xenococcus sp. PCC 7305]ELS05558.1 DMT(drug/metabolite transporter) superfamily permease [Xenococcus sp. PCC 7305]